jgi:lipid-A-disaccharide synthase-like uncharacterized protein
MFFLAKWNRIDHVEMTTLPIAQLIVTARQLSFWTERFICQIGSMRKLLPRFFWSNSLVGLNYVLIGP